MEIVEPKLGDVVSGDLWSLVNKLCETDHEQLLRCRLMLLVARLVKLSSNRFKNGRQVAVQIWRPLADGNIQFAVRYFVVPERNAKPRITAIAAKPSRVSAGACPLRDIPCHSEGANELPSTPISDFQKFKPCGSGGSLGYRPGNANRT